MNFSNDLGDSKPSIAVLIPCLNEAQTIAQVVKDFKNELPDSDVFVYDNGSTDDTIAIAVEAGAKVRSESMKGKGSVLRRMFADIKADVFVVVDGDNTYDSSSVDELIKTLLDNNLDMVVACRKGAMGRRGHRFGNWIFNKLNRWLFGPGFSDIFSGYRALSQRYVKSFPAISNGFEIETEMSVHASQLRIPVAELDVLYKERPEGSKSKLRTFKDGWKILRTFISLLKDNKPLTFFGWLAFLTLSSSAALGVPIVIEFARNGLVERLPTAVLASALAVVGLLLIALGLILEMVSRARTEIKRLAYLQSL